MPFAPKKENSMTNTITLTLPDDLAERLAALPAKDINACALAALSKLADAKDAEAFADHDEDEEEVIAAIREGIADYEAGRSQPFEAFHAQIMAELGAAGERAQRADRVPPRAGIGGLPPDLPRGR